MFIYTNWTGLEPVVISQILTVLCGQLPQPLRLPIPPPVRIISIVL